MLAVSICPSPPFERQSEAVSSDCPLFAIIIEYFYCIYFSSFLIYLTLVVVNVRRGGAVRVLFFIAAVLNLGLCLIAVSALFCPYLPTECRFARYMYVCCANRIRSLFPFYFSSIPAFFLVHTFFRLLTIHSLSLRVTLTRAMSHSDDTVLILCACFVLCIFNLISVT